MSTSAMVKPFQVTAGFYKDLPQISVEEYPGTQGYIADVYTNPAGSHMSSGYFELKSSETFLEYFYDYDEMRIILDGELRLKNPDTGQVAVAKKYDAIFFPKGSHILFSTPNGALAFFVDYRSVQP